MNAFAHASNGPEGPKLDNRRVLAAVIDIALIGVGGAMLVTLVGMVAGGEASLTSPTVGAVMAAWALYYYFALESGEGQTVGKKLMNLRVVKADGSPAGMREVAVRTVLRVVDGLFAYLVGLIVMMATGERRQRLGDLAAGTMVADASAAPAETASAAAAATAPASDVSGRGEAAGDEPKPLTWPEPMSSPRPPAVADFDFYDQSRAAKPEEPADQPAFEPAAPTAEQHSLSEAHAPSAEEPTASPEPVADERPAPVEPVAETPWFEQIEPAEPVAEEQPTPAEPVAEEFSLGQPAAGEPAAEEHPVEAPAEQPSFEASTPVEPSPAEPEPEQPGAVEPPSGQSAAPAEASGGGPTPEESLAALMRKRSAPAPAAGSEAAPAPDAPPEQQQDDVSVRSVETVSAIDLVMGGDEERDESSDDDDGPQPQAQ